MYLLRIMPLFCFPEKVRLRIVVVSLCAGLAWAVPDTLEIYALRVEFKYEDPDNSLTTGRGLFDSDADTASANYSLDPMGSRASSEYWMKHLQFANRYFQVVSGGRMAIEPKIYPRQKRSYVLDKGIIDYNRTARKKDEKVAEFDEARLRDYMTFVWDALHKAAQDSTDSPFSDPLPDTPRRRRAYLIIHAGASRLLDGGSLGTTGADTPGDFLDLFVPRGDAAWGFLEKDSLRSAARRGFVLRGYPIDTVHEVMVISETASQDGLNWGINGMLVHQIGRQIGMPQTYDVVKGISRLGVFDVMDFAGYSAGSGFLPVWPSAWIRAYMGWAQVRELRPDETGKATAFLYAPGGSAGDEILKIALSPTEYLLLENRQRTLDPRGLVTLDLDGGSIEIPADSLHLMFQDSICNEQGKNCKKNPRKARGIITGVSSYDAALPASGVAVWHVNEWVLRDNLPYGAVNFWAGDTFRDHYYGIALMEADRIPSIGKEFRNAMGQPAYDYGSGADLLPHARFSRQAGGKIAMRDTVRTLEPAGYANTASVLAGYTGLKIRVRPDSGAVAERTANGFLGDSVINWRSPVMRVEVEWADFTMEASQWPRRTAADNMPGFGLSVKLPDVPGVSGLGVAVLSRDGSLQIWGARGEALFAANGERQIRPLVKTDSTESVPLWRIGSPGGEARGLAAEDSTLYALRGRSLWRVRLMEYAGTLTYLLDSAEVSTGAVGPLVVDGRVWVADSLGLIAWRRDKTAPDHMGNWRGFTPMDLGICGDVDGDGSADIAVVGTSGRIALWGSATGRMEILSMPEGWSDMGNSAGQKYQIACTDFNRDGNSDAFVLGNAGNAWIVDIKRNRLLSPARRYVRGQQASLEVPGGDESAVALADLNGDGYPEAVFSGYNRLYAVDSSGVPLSGFPVLLTRGYPEEVLRSSPLILDVDGNGVADILLPLPGGQMMAVDARGRILRETWPRLTGAHAFDSLIQPQSAWIGGFGDSLLLYTAHRDFLSGWRLPGALLKPAASWTDFKGNAQRQNWLDPQKLAAPLIRNDSFAVREFFVFPNPVRRGKASVRFDLGTAAESVGLKVYDISGLEVLRLELGRCGKGWNQRDALDFSALGSDIYSVKLEVRFNGKNTKSRWDRVAVIR